jgi:hypothetical protein
MNGILAAHRSRSVGPETVRHERKLGGRATAEGGDKAQSRKKEFSNVNQKIG